MFAAIIQKQGTLQLAPDVETRIIDLLHPRYSPDAKGTYRCEEALLVQTEVHNLACDASQDLPVSCPDTGRVLVGWVRLDNRPELEQKLGRDHASDAALILRAYNRWGQHCPDRLEGDFSFAIYSPESRSLFCARDVLGARPLYYAETREHIIVASTAAGFPHLAPASCEPDEDWIAHYLIGLPGSFTGTAFRGVRRLAPAHFMQTRGNENCEVRRYHQFEDRAPKIWKRDTTRVDAYREAFYAAVENRLRSRFPIGAEFSGGLDSTTIAGRAAPVLQDRGMTLAGFAFTIAADEEPLVEEARDFIGIAPLHIEAEVPDCTQAMRETALAAIGYPPEHANSWSHIPFYRSCEAQGIRTLLSGFGGDEIVTAHGSELPLEFLAARRFANLKPYLPRHPVRALRWLRENFDLLRSGHKPEPGLQELFKRRWDARIVTERLEGDGSLELIQLGRADKQHSNTINGQILAYALRPYVNARLENCSLVAAAYGVDYRWPLLDKRLIQQYLDTPAIEKRRGHVGRYLHRSACDGIAPDSIVWRPHKSMGALPHNKRLPLRRETEAQVEALDHSVWTYVNKERLLQLFPTDPLEPQDQVIFAMDMLTRTQYLATWLSQLRASK